MLKPSPIEPVPEGTARVAKAAFRKGNPSSAFVTSSAPSSSTRTSPTRGPALGRAEALRRSMLALLASDARLHFAHPGPGPRSWSSARAGRSVRGRVSERACPCPERVSSRCLFVSAV
jgi:hypothetical protein